MLKYQKRTVEGDLILNQITYTVAKGFSLFNDNSRDRYGSREIVKKDYKYLNAIKHETGELALYLSNTEDEKALLKTFELSAESEPYEWYWVLDYME